MASIQYPHPGIILHRGRVDCNILSEHYFENPSGSANQPDLRYILMLNTLDAVLSALSRTRPYIRKKSPDYSIYLRKIAHCRAYIEMLLNCKEIVL